MKKPKYKIIDGGGKTIAKGFKSRGCAKKMLPHYKLNKQDKLEVVEE